jgi:hypothetical protein
MKLKVQAGMTSSSFRVNYRAPTASASKESENAAENNSLPSTSITSGQKDFGTKADFERWLTDSNLIFGPSMSVCVAKPGHSFGAISIWKIWNALPSSLSLLIMQLFPEIGSRSNKALAMFAAKSVFESDIILTESSIALSSHGYQ